MAIEPLPHRVEMPSDDGMPYQFEGIQQNFDALLRNDQSLQDQIDDLEETVDGLDSGGGSGAPTDAQYIVAASDGDLTAERVATDHGVTDWDFGTAGQAKLKIKKVIGCVIDSGGATMTTGFKGFVRIPWDCTITKVSMMANPSGDIVVDVWKDTFANFPPTVADTITASAKPTISSAVTYEDSTLTGWTTSVTAGDVLAFNVDSVTDVTRCVVELEVLI